MLSGRALAEIIWSSLRQARLWSFRSGSDRLFPRLRSSNHRGYRQGTRAKVSCALGHGGQGAGAAIAYAVKSPDRVSHLILCSAQARSHGAPGRRCVEHHDTSLVRRCRSEFPSPLVRIAYSATKTLNEIRKPHSIIRQFPARQRSPTNPSSLKSVGTFRA